MRTKNSLPVFLLCGSLVVVISCRKDASDDAEQDSGGDELVLRLSDKDLESMVGAESAKYAKRPCRKLTIAEPVQVKDAAGYWDGGSRYLTLVDAAGVEYEFMVWKHFHGPMDISRGGKKGKPERVELAGPEEQDLYGVLLRWILAHPERDGLLGKYEFHPVTDRLLFESRQFYGRMQLRVVPEQVEAKSHPKPIDRSWIEGTMTVSASKQGSETRIVVSGSWRDGKPGLKVRFYLALIDKKGREQSRYARSRPLGTFKDEVASFPDYSTVAKPFRFACDYEIWDGEPGKGQLLAKNSVFSPWYDE